MAYLDSLTEAQRKAMLTPSKGLQQYLAFAREYRKAHPDATGNQVQHAFQTKQS